jgi:hypothetical protein
MDLGRLVTNGSKKGAPVASGSGAGARLLCAQAGGGRRDREIRFSRFLRHPAVTPEVIFAAAGEGTSVLVKGRAVLAIQDNSHLMLGGAKRRKQGFGPVGKGGAQSGLSLHAVLAVDAMTGEVLGLVGGQVWNRTGGKKVAPRASRSLDEKESQRWMRGAETAARILSKASSITVVADRESDIYEDYTKRPPGMELLTVFRRAKLTHLVARII